MGACANYDITEKGQIRSVSAKGQSASFDMASSQYEGSFIRGEFASHDFFIEVLLESSRRNTALANLFQVTKTRKYICPLHPRDEIDRASTSTGEHNSGCTKECLCHEQHTGWRRFGFDQIVDK
jgi:hypothetical protein